jgi:hypothetical protein
MTKKQISALVVSYDEKAHGDFEPAVTISNQCKYVAWLHPTLLKPDCPMPIKVFVRIKNDTAQRCYVGELQRVAPKDDLPDDFAHRERAHRLPSWREHSWKTALFISGLRLERNPPPEATPQRNAKYIRRPL